MRREHSHRLATERRLARDHRVDEDSRRVNVSAMIDLGSGIQCLGKGEAGRAQKDPCLGQVLVLIAELHEPEIKDLHEIHIVITLD